MIFICPLDICDYKLNSLFFLFYNIHKKNYKHTNISSFYYYYHFLFHLFFFYIHIYKIQIKIQNQNKKKYQTNFKLQDKPLNNLEITGIAFSSRSILFFHFYRSAFEISFLLLRRWSCCEGGPLLWWPWSSVNVGCSTVDDLAARRCDSREGVALLGEHGAAARGWGRRCCIPSEMRGAAVGHCRVELETVRRKWEA